MRLEQVELENPARVGYMLVMKDKEDATAARGNRESSANFVRGRSATYRWRGRCARVGCVVCRSIDEAIATDLFSNN